MDDAERFRSLFEAAYPTVRRYAHHRGLAGGRADDVVAETFLVAWRRLDVVPQDDPVPWLLGVARNVWLNERRGDRRRLAMLRRLPAPIASPPPEEPTPERGVRAALAALGDADREVLMLVAWDGLSATQAGEALGIGAGTARVRLHRARKRLTLELEKRAAAGGQATGEEAIDEGAGR